MTDIEQWIMEEGRKDIAISAINEGIDIETVARITGMPRDDVHKLKLTRKKLTTKDSLIPKKNSSTYLEEDDLVLPKQIKARYDADFEIIRTRRKKINLIFD